MFITFLLFGLLVGCIWGLITPTSFRQSDNFAFAGFHDVYRWFIRPGLYAAMFGWISFSLGLIVDGAIYFIY